jgi:hypothetical protein
MKGHTVIFCFSILLLLIAPHPVASQSQQVSGKVRDAITLEALPFAHVFINQTSIGTATDEAGHFRLEDLPPGTYELVVSFVGYNRYKSKIEMSSGETLTLDIRLVEDSRQLIEVEVTGTRDRVWERQLKKFTRVFFGNTSFANACKILNPWVLEFREERVSDKNSFSASSTRPLEIENHALGYTIIYYLRSLVSTAAAYSILGEVHFQEMEPADKKQQAIWRQNRSTAYLGSYRHLLASILEGRVKEEGFELYYHTGNPDIAGMQNQSSFSLQHEKSIKAYSTAGRVQAVKEGLEYKIQLRPQLEVHYSKVYTAPRVYRDITHPVSWLEIRGGVLEVNRAGIVLNPSVLTVSGAMYEARVAYLLPDNYRHYKGG